MSEVKDARGDKIVDGSYVRLPEGRHAFVVALPSSSQPYVTVELKNGGRAYFAAESLVTTKPSQRAVTLRKIAAAERHAISAASHANARRR